MKDQFSKQASGYARYRPVYPSSLFDFILSRVDPKENAWDCGTGNGQTAIVLSKSFKNVYATDISKDQLAKAQPSPNIQYSAQAAEVTDFPSGHFDLITVSQALHWFNFDSFYAEVRRVGKDKSWIAVWMYALPRISPAIDKLVRHHHFEILGDYWEPERRYVDEDYEHIPFPFREIESPSFQIDTEWTITDLEGYLNTQSALQKFISVNQSNSVDLLMGAIGREWSREKLPVRFPIRLRMGQINK